MQRTKQGRPKDLPMSACALILTERGIVVVVDPARNNPRPKFPGGKEELCDGRNPKRTAARELEEETGLRVNWRDLKVVGKYSGNGTRRGRYVSYLTVGICTDLNGLKKMGNEGEEVHFISDPKIVLDPNQFLIQHALAAKRAFEEGRFSFD